MSDEMLTELRARIQAADSEGAVETVRRLLDEGADPKVVLETGMAAAMMELGEQWKCGDVYLPEVVAAAEVFKACTDLVEPILIERGGKRAGHLVVMATVKGDLHDLGKNMVGAMLRSSGFQVHDLGRDVPTDDVVGAVRDLKPALVGLSALLTTTVEQQQVVIESLADAGLRDEVRIMVGGAPVTEEWADKIGADGFAASAPEAVDMALKLAGEPQ